MASVPDLVSLAVNAPGSPSPPTPPAQGCLACIPPLTRQPHQVLPETQPPLLPLPPTHHTVGALASPPRGQGLDARGGGRCVRGHFLRMWPGQLLRLPSALGNTCWAGLTHAPRWGGLRAPSASPSACLCRPGPGRGQLQEGAGEAGTEPALPALLLGPVL